MKQINFQELKIKNFLSVGDVPVVIGFNKGLNIITGINKDKLDRRNGVGKSTVADALYFSVFGQTLRELKKEHISNNKTSGDAEVELSFQVIDNNETTNYKIVRTLVPSKCYLYKENRDITLDSISNTNSYIQSLINSSPEVFQNCIIMTVNNTTPFMAKKRIEKRKFIEGILNLEVFGDMLSTARSDYNDISKSFDVECAKYEEVSKSLENYKEQSDNYNIQIKNQKDSLSRRIDNNTSKINELKNNIDDNLPDVNGTQEQIDALSEDLALVDDKLPILTSKMSRVETKIDYENNVFNKIGTDSSTCPVCLRPMDEHDNDLIKEEKNKIMLRVNEMQNTLKDLKVKYKAAIRYKSKLSKHIQKNNKIIQNVKLKEVSIKNISTQIDDLVARNKELSNDIGVLDKQDNQFEKNVHDTSNRLDEIQSEINNIKGVMHTLDIVKFIVSEEGVKAYIVKKILQLLNGKLAYYLKQMDSNCVCVFNEYFEEQIIDEKGKVCSYFNFSGAERKNIDLACLFAFMDIRRLQGDVAFNFSIYDELFDSSLDEKGVEIVIGILRERIEKYNECVMVISHRKESTKLATNEIIFLQKENGITTRVDPTAIQD